MRTSLYFLILGLLIVVNLSKSKHKKSSGKKNKDGMVKQDTQPETARDYGIKFSTKTHVKLSKKEIKKCKKNGCKWGHWSKYQNCTKT